MKFEDEVAGRIGANGKNAKLQSDARALMDSSIRAGYSYNFSWLGRPIIQYPQDIVAMQEIIWRVQPDLIIETGIAHGGSLVFSAAMLELNAACGGPNDAKVLGIDIDIRAHNRAAIEAHPMFKRISMIEGSSVATEVVEEVRRHAAGKCSVLVCLDSNHTHAHVLAELRAYAPLVTIGSYCVVFDTIVEDLPSDLFPDRPWGPGDNPKTAVAEFMASTSDFEIDRQRDDQLLISVAPTGYLKRTR
ncbi:cephalosporin hydroxylase family protein [Variovorax rhizosphaerae]|uniref:Cephalosporin hydroxylase family protein n=1 Tax=Variovorax rhizosphaerae TaxID=1836200 RepID=A0ABU8WHT7_9BURK